MIPVSGKRRDSDSEQQQEEQELEEQIPPSQQQEQGEVVEEGFGDEYYMSKRRGLGVAKWHRHAQLPSTGGLDDDDEDTTRGDNNNNNSPGMMPVMIEPNYSDEEMRAYLQAQDNRDVRCRNCLYVWALGVLVGLLVVVISNRNNPDLAAGAALGSSKKKANTRNKHAGKGVMKPDANGCIATNEDLLAAVDEYVNPMATSLSFGPIQEWCFGQKVNSMVKLFDPERNRVLQDFNADLSRWDVSRIVDMESMFRDDVAFNSDLSRWDVSKVTNMENMFRGARSFNQDLYEWQVGNVIEIDSMFQGAVKFNQDISRWDVSNVKDFFGMFNYATSFNIPIGKWDVSNAQDMRSMFQSATSFNQDIGAWNVGKVQNIGLMFNGATKFNQNLCGWGMKLSNLKTFTDAFLDTVCPHESDPKLIGTPDHFIITPFCYDCV